MKLLKENKPDAFGLNHYGTSFVAYDNGNTDQKSYS